MVRNLAANGLNLLILALLVVAALIGWGVGEYRRPGPLTAPAIVLVPEGAGLNRIAEELERAGAIRHPLVFRLGARYAGQAAALKYGEYALPPGASMADIVTILASGRSILHRVTIPEGLSSYQVVERLRALDFLAGEVAEIPSEGSLAPDTYNVQRGTARQALIDEMAAAQNRILAAAWEARAPDLPLASAEEALILASIVEKETGIAAERPQVASVFLNRLRKGMRLETDPAVIYGITGGRHDLDRGLTQSELGRHTPYNTYRIAGLPPTPIANPGRAAIEAVLTPAETPFLFFVADGTGGHAFATTKREHDANVRKWRAIEADRARQRPAEGTTQPER
ncbi:MAG TPA: endolytic transglycosylase MltG [Paracoccaceae bacterium]|nr:endolytic transglycosylase MltG [Paracoccaceae bacterium]